MNYVVISKYGIPSVKALFPLLKDAIIIKNFDGVWKKLAQSTRGDYLIWTRIDTPIFNEQDKILRWGCSTPLRFNGATLYNRADAIRLASNKYEARVKMKERNVPVPKTTSVREWGYSQDDFPVIVRPLKHYGGKNFHIYIDNDPLIILCTEGISDEYYCSEVYNKQREVRVHVAHGKILSIQEKPLQEGVIQANQAITHESWTTIRWGDYEKDICKIACDAVKAIGLDCGAVDVMIDRRNREMPVCICEVNTAPSLSSSPYDLARYSKYINWLFREPREWFNYEKWRIGKSYAFKNGQLEE